MEKINFKIDNSDTKIIQSYVNRVVSDPEVAAFLSKEKISNIIAQKNINTLGEVLTMRETYPHYDAVFSYRGNNILVSYKIKDTDVGNRLKDKRSSRFNSNILLENDKHVSLDNVMLDEFNYNLYEKLIDYLNGYFYGTTKKGLWINGPLGVGKTYLMTALSKDLNKIGAGIEFISINHFIESLKENMSYKVNNNQAMINRLKKAEILILDDLGTEQMTDWSIKTIIYNIIDYRFLNSLPVFVTSNFTIKEYEQIIKNKLSNTMDAERLRERIQVLMDEYHLNGNNRRKK